MRNIQRLGLVLGAMLLASVLSRPAFAAAPGNDTAVGATAVTTFPFTDLINTAEATTDANDAQANEYWGWSATDASVWYTITPTSDTNVWVDTSGSEYWASVIVATGSPGSLTPIIAGSGGTQFFATAGTTYFILVFDDQSDGGGNGGKLRVWIGDTDPVATVTLTWRVSFEPKSGVATVSGTMTCQHAYVVWLNGTLTQPVGRFAVQGDFAFAWSLDPSICDGNSHQWSATVTNQTTAKFAGGKATLRAGVTLFGVSGNSFWPIEQEVQIRRK